MGYQPFPEPSLYDMVRLAPTRWCANSRVTEILCAQRLDTHDSCAYPSIVVATLNGVCAFDEYKVAGKKRRGRRS